MASSLIDSLSDSVFEPGKYEDSYREAMLGLIQSKIEGKEAEHPPAVAVEPEATDLMSALQASVSAAKEARENDSAETDAGGKTAQSGSASGKNSGSKSSSGAKSSKGKSSTNKSSAAKSSGRKSQGGKGADGEDSRGSGSSGGDSGQDGAAAEPVKSRSGSSRSTRKTA